MNGPQAAKEVGLTYRQLDYLIRIGVFTPTENGARGRDRIFTDRDIGALKFVVVLRKLNFSYFRIKVMVELLGRENYGKWVLEANDKKKTWISVVWNEENKDWDVTYFPDAPRDGPPI